MMADSPSASGSWHPREAPSRSPPPGSRYLALLFTDEGSRAALGSLYAFEAEVRRIVDLHSHEAAHARLQWWHAELDRLAGGHPTHPVSVALLALRERGFTDWGLLRELLVAADLDLARFTYHSWPELEAYCFRAAGSLQSAAAAVLADGRALEEREREFARRLGAGLRQTEMLRDLHVDAGRGRLYAPLDVLRRANVDPTSIIQGDMGAAEQSFLHDWRGRVRAQLDGLDALLGSRALRRTHRHGLVLASLHLRILDRLPDRRSHPVRRLDLEPLARLWSAWRTAVRNA